MGRPDPLGLELLDPRSRCHFPFGIVWGSMVGRRLAVDWDDPFSSACGSCARPTSPRRCRHLPSAPLIILSRQHVQQPAAASGHLSARCGDIDPVGQSTHRNKTFTPGRHVSARQTFESKTYRTSSPGCSNRSGSASHRRWNSASAKYPQHPARRNHERVLWGQLEQSRVGAARGSVLHLTWGTAKNPLLRLKVEVNPSRKTPTSGGTLACIGTLYPAAA